MMNRRRMYLAVAGALLATAVIMPGAVLATSPCTHATTWWTPSNQGSRPITPPGGTANTIYARFSSTWKKDTFDPITICYSIAGTSRAAWTGTVPYNATNVKLVDQWHVDGLGITVGLPPGAGFSIDGTTLSWETDAPTNWHNDHSFVDFWFKVVIPLGYWEQATGFFTFGGSSYNVNAYAQH